MNRLDKTYLIHQFKSCRTEILAIKERVGRIQTVAISGIPIMIAAGNIKNFEWLTILSPVIISVVALMLMFEQESIMRAGRYIRDVLEPKMKSYKIIGWECYLEEGSENRRAEKYFVWSVMIALAFYYVIGTFLTYYLFPDAFCAIVGLIPKTRQTAVGILLLEKNKKYLELMKGVRIAVIAIYVGCFFPLMNFVFSNINRSAKTGEGLDMESMKRIMIYGKVKSKSQKALEKELENV